MVKFILIACVLCASSLSAFAKVEVYRCRGLLSRAEGSLQINGRTATLDRVIFISQGRYRENEDGLVEIFDGGSVALEVYLLNPRTNVRDVILVDKSGEAPSERLICRRVGAQG